MKCDVKTERPTVDLVELLNKNEIPIVYYKVNCSDCDGELYNRAECGYFVNKRRQKDVFTNTPDAD